MRRRRTRKGCNNIAAASTVPLLLVVVMLLCAGAGREVEAMTCGHNMSMVGQENVSEPFNDAWTPIGAPCENVSCTVCVIYVEDTSLDTALMHRDTGMTISPPVHINRVELRPYNTESRVTVSGDMSTSFGRDDLSMGWFQTNFSSPQGQINANDYSGITLDFVNVIFGSEHVHTSSSVSTIEACHNGAISFESVEVYGMRYDTGARFLQTPNSYEGSITIGGNSIFRDTEADPDAAFITVNGDDASAHITVDGATVHDVLVQQPGGSSFGSFLKVTFAWRVDLRNIHASRRTDAAFRPSYGGFAALRDVVSVRVENCNFTNGLAENSGGALYVGDPESVFIADSTFDRNEAFQLGGAVFVESFANDHVHNITAIDSTFTKNTAKFGGGLRLSIEQGVSAEYFLSDLHFTANTAAEQAGGLSVFFGDQFPHHMDVRHSTFHANEVNDPNTGNFSGGAMHVLANEQSTAAAIVDMSYCTFTDNRVRLGDGGALSVLSRQLDDATQLPLELNIYHAGFERNEADRSGGALFANATNVLLWDTTFRRNTARNRDGGAVAMAYSNLYSRWSTFTNNTAERTGGAMEHRCSRYLGSAVVRDTSFHSNQAMQLHGGAMVLAGMEPTTSCEGDTDIVDVNCTNNRADNARGGCIHTESRHLRVAEGNVENNTAEEGGGISAISGGKFGRLIVAGARLVNNTAASNGGAIQAAYANSVNITGGTAILDNWAGIGGGGVDICDTNRSIIEQTYVRRNTATMEGGGIRVDGENWARFDMQDSTLTDNTCANNGCGLMLQNGTDAAAVLRNVHFHRNQATNDADGVSGSAISATGVHQFTMRDGSVTDSQGAAAGSVSIYRPARVVLDGTSFMNNVGKTVSTVHIQSKHFQSAGGGSSRRLRQTQPEEAANGRDSFANRLRLAHVAAQVLTENTRRLAPAGPAETVVAILGVTVRGDRTHNASVGIANIGVFGAAEVVTTDLSFEDVRPYGAAFLYAGLRAEHRSLLYHNNLTASGVQRAYAVLAAPYPGKTAMVVDGATISNCSTQHLLYDFVSAADRGKSDFVVEGLDARNNEAEPLYSYLGDPQQGSLFRQLFFPTNVSSPNATANATATATANCTATDADAFCVFNPIMVLSDHAIDMNDCTFANNTGGWVAALGLPALPGQFQGNHSVTRTRFYENSTDANRIVPILLPDYDKPEIFLGKVESDVPLTRPYKEFWYDCGHPLYPVSFCSAAEPCCVNTTTGTDCRDGNAADADVGAWEYIYNAAHQKDFVGFFNASDTSGYFGATDITTSNDSALIVTSAPLLEGLTSLDVSPTPMSTGDGVIFVMDPFMDEGGIGGGAPGLAGGPSLTANYPKYPVDENTTVATRLFFGSGGGGGDDDGGGGGDGEGVDLVYLVTGHPEQNAVAVSMLNNSIGGNGAYWNYVTRELNTSVVAASLPHLESVISSSTGFGSAVFVELEYGHWFTGQRFTPVIIGGDGFLDLAFIFTNESEEFLAETFTVQPLEHIDLFDPAIQVSSSAQPSMTCEGASARVRSIASVGDMTWDNENEVLAGLPYCGVHGMVAVMELVAAANYTDNGDDDTVTVSFLASVYFLEPAGTLWGLSAGVALVAAPADLRRFGYNVMSWPDENDDGIEEFAVSGFQASATSIHAVREPYLWVFSPGFSHKLNTIIIKDSYFAGTLSPVSCAGPQAIPGLGEQIQSLVRPAFGNKRYVAVTGPTADAGTGAMGTMAISVGASGQPSTSIEESTFQEYHCETICIDHFSALVELRCSGNVPNGDESFPVVCVGFQPATQGQPTDTEYAYAFEYLRSGNNASLLSYPTRNETLMQFVDPTRNTSLQSNLTLSFSASPLQDAHLTTMCAPPTDTPFWRTNLSSSSFRLPERGTPKVVIVSTLYELPTLDVLVRLDGRFAANVSCLASQDSESVEPVEGLAIPVSVNETRWFTFAGVIGSVWNVTCVAQVPVPNPSAACTNARFTGTASMSVQIDATFNEPLYISAPSTAGDDGADPGFCAPHNKANCTLVSALYTATLLLRDLDWPYPAFVALTDNETYTFSTSNAGPLDLTPHILQNDVRPADFREHRIIVGGTQAFAGFVNSSASEYMSPRINVSASSSMVLGWLNLTFINTTFTGSVTGNNSFMQRARDDRFSNISEPYDSPALIEHALQPLSVTFAGRGVTGLTVKHGNAFAQASAVFLSDFHVAYSTVQHQDSALVRADAIEVVDHVSVWQSDFGGLPMSTSSAPSPSPTGDPTAAPTQAPSSSPTGTPAPTPAPSSAPTATPAPTQAPSSSPTATPAPTQAPSSSPFATPAPTVPASIELPVSEPYTGGGAFFDARSSLIVESASVHGSGTSVCLGDGVVFLGRDLTKDSDSYFEYAHFHDLWLGPQGYAVHISVQSGATLYLDDFDVDSVHTDADAPFAVFGDRNHSRRDRDGFNVDGYVNILDGDFRNTSGTVATAWLLDLNVILEYTDFENVFVGDFDTAPPIIVQPDRENTSLSISDCWFVVTTAGPAPAGTQEVVATNSSANGGILLRNNVFRPNTSFYISADTSVHACPLTSEVYYQTHDYTSPMCDSLATCTVLADNLGYDCECVDPLSGDAYWGCKIPPGTLRIVPNPLQLGDIAKPETGVEETALINAGQTLLLFEVVPLAQFCFDPRYMALNATETICAPNTTMPTMEYYISTYTSLFDGATFYDNNATSATLHSWSYFDDEGEPYKASNLAACSFVTAQLSITSTSQIQGSYFSLWVVDSDSTTTAQLLPVTWTVEARANASTSNFSAFAYNDTAGGSFLPMVLDAGVGGTTSITSGHTMVVQVFAHDRDGLLIPSPRTGDAFEDEYAVRIVEPGVPANFSSVGCSFYTPHATTFPSPEGRTAGVLNFACVVPKLLALDYQVELFINDIEVEQSQNHFFSYCQTDFAQSGTACTCGPGYALDKELEVCQPCGEGFYKNTTGDNPCTQCNAPAEALSPAVNGTATYTACGCESSSGYIEVNGTCECKAGLEFTSTAEPCSSCAQGEYKETAGNAKCDSCKIEGQTTPSEGSKSKDDCVCPQGFYLSSDQVCTECPSGATCSSTGDINGVGVGLSSMSVKSGFWRVDASSDTVLVCPVPDACAGSKGGNTSQTWGDGLCATGHHGPYCSVCNANRYKEYDGMCVKCSPDAIAESYILMAVLTGVVVVSFYFLVVWTCRLAAERHAGGAQTGRSLFDHLERRGLQLAEKSLSRSGGNTKRKGATRGKNNDNVFGSEADGSGAADDKDEMTTASSRRGSRRGSADGSGEDGQSGGSNKRAQSIVVKLKIAFVFFQIVLLFANSYTITFPPRYSEFLSLFSFLGLDWIRVTQLECAVSGGYESRLLLSCLLPLGIFGVMLVVWLASWSRYGSRDNPGHIFIQNTLVNLFLLVTYILFPGLSSTIFSAFVCEDFDDGTSLLRADYAVDCNSEEYDRIYAFAAFMVFVYPLGIPALYMTFLYRRRHTLNPLKQHPDMSLGAVVQYRERNCTYLKFLYDSFKPKFYWMEVFECLRKLGLAGFVVFLYTGSVLQIFCGLLVSIVSLVLYCYTRPYLFKTNNYFAIFAHSALTLTLVGMAMLRVLAVDPDSSEANKEAYRYDENDVAIFLIVSNAAVLVVGAVIIIYSCFKTSERDFLDAGYAVDEDGNYIIENDTGAGTAARLDFDKKNFTLDPAVVGGTAAAGSSAAAAAATGGSTHQRVGKPKKRMLNGEELESPDPMSPDPILRPPAVATASGVPNQQLPAPKKRPNSVTFSDAPDVSDASAAGAADGSGIEMQHNPQHQDTAAAAEASSDAAEASGAAASDLNNRNRRYYNTYMRRPT